MLKKLNKTFVIAEIGQNHQGDLNIAKKLIKVAKECGADCVKFQKTDLKQKFTKDVLERPYSTENSFGKTYGEHKSFLEFTNDDFIALQKYAKECEILFTASAMDSKSLEFLIQIQVPFIKIGSGDANNLILIEEASNANIPLVISTGMQNFETVKLIYNTVSKYHKNFALLHCVSSYPTPYEEINLNVINLYKKEFPDIIIGYSGHELGTHITVASVAMGSRIIERHITLDKNLKGTDHKCSLEPSEFKQLINNIKTLEASLGQALKARQSCEFSCYDKLGKTLVYTNKFQKGHLITLTDMDMKVAINKGIEDTSQVVGKILNKNVNEDESVQNQHFI